MTNRIELLKQIATTMGVWSESNENSILESIDDSSSITNDCSNEVDVIDDCTTEYSGATALDRIYNR